MKVDSDRVVIICGIILYIEGRITQEPFLMIMATIILILATVDLGAE